ncbi:hypothetical protein BaRGS_00023344 [Batillaria attramentaria]|uniref:Uncharacterized protein n=1 Tax=Batillaria attramentaria TaxID=370345 RepID=A0ABD0KE22_9CAEN
MAAVSADSDEEFNDIPEEFIRERELGLGADNQSDVELLEFSSVHTSDLLDEERFRVPSCESDEVNDSEFPQFKSMAARRSTRAASKRAVTDQEKADSTCLGPRATNIISAPKKRMTSSEATRAWKQRMKENEPERFEAYKEAGRQAYKAYRQGI